VSQLAFGEPGINVLKGEGRGTKGAAKDFLVLQKHSEKTFCA
jgi:hypothetical protein